MTFEQAKKQARANADYFHAPYCVVFASNLRYYVERYSTQDESCVVFVAQPIKATA
jgi:hypothetical protein